MQHPDDIEDGDLQLPEPGRMCYNMESFRYCGTIEIREDIRF